MAASKPPWLVELELLADDLVEAYLTPRERLRLTMASLRERFPLPDEKIPHSSSLRVLEGGCQATVRASHGGWSLVQLRVVEGGGP
jgi:hypothetical protein